MRTEIFTVLALALAVLGIARLLTTTDLVRRVIALNVASGGVLMLLLVVAARSEPADAVPHALALTGIVITVSVTGLALVLVRRIETAEPARASGSDDRSAAAPPAGGNGGAAASSRTGDDREAAAPRSPGDAREAAASRNPDDTGGHP